MSEAGGHEPKRRTPYWVMISGFWVLITMATALQDWLTQRGDLVTAMRFAASIWLPWAFLTPALAWFSSTFPLERNQWRRALAGHLGICAVASVLFGLLSYWAGPPPGLRSTAAGKLHRPPPKPPIVEMILRRTIFQLPIYCAIVGVAQAFVFYERARERERHAAVLEARLTKARLQGLQMQLNPHFLFNTLNAIASLIHENPRAADEMIGSLSDFLRLTLKTSDRSEVTLREELQYLDHYLTIEQIRFGDRLRVEKEIDPAALDLLVPVLILQPLVENAIKHGIESRIASGVVRVTAACAGDCLRLQVADNGRGLKDNAEDDLREGVGLANTRARLNEIAGVAAALHLGASPGGGVVAEIRLPRRVSSTALRPVSVPAALV